MIITADIGNTTVNLCGLEKAGNDLDIAFSEKFATDKTENTEYYRKHTKDVLLKYKDAVDGVIISSVVPDVTDKIISAIKTVTGKESVVLSSQSRLNIKLNVEKTEALGADRIADSVWAAKKYPLPAVTADLGTATTLNVITEECELIGGAIAPGIATSLNALTEKASRLPDITPTAAKNVIGKNTEECMLSGTVIGTAAMIDGLIARTEKLLGKTVTLIITGGMSELVMPHLTADFVYEPYLLQKGLAEAYLYNVE